MSPTHSSVHRLISASSAAAGGDDDSMASKIRLLSPHPSLLRSHPTHLLHPGLVPPPPPTTPTPPHQKQPRGSRPTASYRTSTSPPSQRSSPLTLARSSAVYLVAQYSRYEMRKMNEESLDDITLFSVITVMSFLMSAPLALFMEGIKFTPSVVQSAGLNVRDIYIKSLLAGLCFHAYQQVILAEEVAASKLTIFDKTNQICDAVQARAEKDKNHGIILIPEGMVESIPDLYALLQEIHGLHRQGVSMDNISAHLSPWASALFEFLPPFIRKQILLHPESYNSA